MRNGPSGKAGAWPWAHGTPRTHRRNRPRPLRRYSPACETNFGLM